MPLDPIIPLFVITVLALAIFGLLMHFVRQPLLIGYVLTGFLLGPAVLGIITDFSFMSRLGSAGVVLLLFFVGMTVSPAALRNNWRVAVVGTTLQILVSTALVVGLGALIGWPVQRSLLLGFVVALSSTAIAMKLLEDQSLLHTGVGQDAAGITLFQDLAVIPMILILSLMSGEKISVVTLSKQCIAAVLFFALIAWLSKPRTFILPYGKIIENDRELQVLLAIGFCFGLGLVSSLMGLSTAFGAFAAGIVLGMVRETKWVENSLSGFRVIFVAMFFASVGMLVDIGFVRAHWLEISALAGFVVVANTALLAGLLRLLGRPWAHSFYVAAIVAQIGEFSFVLAAIGKTSGIIGNYAYQMTISIIVVTLVASPAWVLLIRKVTGPVVGRLPEKG